MKKPDYFLWISLLIVAIFIFMGIGVDADQYAQHTELKIPTWYFYIIGAIDALQLVGVLLIILNRKSGVFLLPLGILAHFIVHLYYLNSFLYGDLMALFFFTGFGLLAIIPKWKNYS